MSKVLAIIGGVVVIVLSLALAPGAVRSAATPTPVHYLFREDFSTRANRWRVFDLGDKAAVSYGPDGLLLRAEPARYAVWTSPDTDLKPPRFEIETEERLIQGDAAARAGVIVNYHTDDDLLVLAVSHDGGAANNRTNSRVYLGRYTFGLWRDILPPLHIYLDPAQPVIFTARVEANHSATLAINGQPMFNTVIEGFSPGSFGLFALTGQSGGIRATFSRFSVSDVMSTN